MKVKITQVNATWVDKKYVGQEAKLTGNAYGGFFLEFPDGKVLESHLFFFKDVVETDNKNQRGDRV